MCVCVCLCVCVCVCVCLCVWKGGGRVGVHIVFDSQFFIDKQT